MVILLLEVGQRNAVFFEATLKGCFTDSIPLKVHEDVAQEP